MCHMTLISLIGIVPEQVVTVAPHLHLESFRHTSPVFDQESILLCATFLSYEYTSKCFFSS